MRAAPLADLCEPDRRNVRPGDPLADDLPFVGVENVTRDTGFLNFDANSRVGSGKSVSFRFDERHVLYGKLAPYLNKVATPDFAGRCSTELVPLLPRGGVDRDFLAHMLRRRETVEFAVAFANGTRMPRVDMKLLMAMPIPFPPFDAQRRIAGVLNRAARIVRLREKANDRIRRFAPALFVRTFGDPDDNPMGWPVSTLGETCAVVGGGTPSRANPEYFGGSVPWATPTDITALKVPYIGETKETITETALRESSARRVPAGSVLLTSRATIGAAAVATAPMATNQGFANLKCGDFLSPEYLCFFLRNRAGALNRMANGTTFREISKSTLRTVEIPLPPLDRQRRFAAAVKSASRAAVAASAAADAAAHLAAALAARLLDESP